MIIWFLLFLSVAADNVDWDKHKFNAFMLAGFSELMMESALVILKILN